MTDRTPGTMGQEWIEREIRRADGEEVVAKIRHYEGYIAPDEYTVIDGNTAYHVRANTRPPLPNGEPLFELHREKPGMAETPAGLWRMIWPALVIFIMFAIGAGALIWRMM